MITLITGASRGLGYALGVALAPVSHVIAVGRTIGGLEELDDAINAQGGSSTLVPLDLTDADGVSRMCIALHERWGGIDLWCHTAAQSASLSPAHHIATKDFTKSLDVHVRVALDLIAKIDPLLRAKGGRAVFMGDNHRGEKFFGSYAAAKAAEIALFEAWQAENAKLGPTITRFDPKPMPTATRARFFPGEATSALTPTTEEAQRLLETLGLKPAA